MRKTELGIYLNSTKTISKVLLSLFVIMFLILASFQPVIGKTASSVSSSNLLGTSSPINTAISNDDSARQIYASFLDGDYIFEYNYSLSDQTNYNFRRINYSSYSTFDSILDNHFFIRNNSFFTIVTKNINSQTNFDILVQGDNFSSFFPFKAATFATL